MKPKIFNCHPKFKFKDLFDIGSVVKLKQDIFGSKNFPFDQNDKHDLCLKKGDTTVIADIEHYLEKDSVFYVLKLSFGDYIGWFTIAEWKKRIYDFETLSAKKKVIETEFFESFDLLQK